MMQINKNITNGKVMEIVKNYMGKFEEISQSEM